VRADWLVPGAFNGGFTSRVPIPYFNVNIAALAQKLDEWAVMPDEVLDRHKARALELSRHWDSGGVAAALRGGAGSIGGAHKRQMPATPDEVEGFLDCWLRRRPIQGDAAFVENPLHGR